MKVKIVGTLRWTGSTGVNSLAKGGGKKKRFQYCLNPYSSKKSCTSEQEKTSLIHYCKTIHCSRMTSPSTSTTSGTPTICTAQSGLIPGGKSKRRDRQSVFFTAVNSMDIQPNQREVEYDLDKPRIEPYKHTWRSHHNTVFWFNLKLAHRKGLRFYQTRSHAITLSVKRFVSIMWFA